MMKNVVCPICKGLLSEYNKSLKCPIGHTYDISKHNYVNFMTRGNVHGDNKEMIVSRRDFLNMGYYEKLRDAVANTVFDLGKISSYLDAGCGEGYYTEKILPYVDKNESWGIDISKDALIYANKRIKEFNYAVGSVYDMSFFADSSFDLVTSIFSPFAACEFNRVLKNEGYLISVIPGRTHLFGLKKIIYDSPYENEVKEFKEDGFEFVSKKDVTYNITVDTNTAITLWKMTPYFYRTPKTWVERISHYESIATPVSFHVVLYKAIKD